MVRKNKGTYILAYFLFIFVPYIIITGRDGKVVVFDIIFGVVATIIFIVHFVIRLIDYKNEITKGEIPKRKILKDSMFSVGFAFIFLLMIDYSEGINFRTILVVLMLLLSPLILKVREKMDSTGALKEAYISKEELENKISNLTGTNLSEYKLLILSKKHNCGLGVDMDRTIVITFKEVDNTVKGEIFLLNTMEWSVTNVMDYDLRDKEISISSPIHDSSTYVVLGGTKIALYNDQSGGTPHAECMYNNYGIWYYAQKEVFYEFWDLVKLYNKN